MTDKEFIRDWTVPFDKNAAVALAKARLNSHVQATVGGVVAGIVAHVVHQILLYLEHFIR